MTSFYCVHIMLSGHFLLLRLRCFVGSTAYSPVYLHRPCEARIPYHSYCSSPPPTTPSSSSAPLPDHRFQTTLYVHTRNDTTWKPTLQPSPSSPPASPPSMHLTPRSASITAAQTAPVPRPTTPPASSTPVPSHTSSQSSRAPPTL